LQPFLLLSWTRVSLLFLRPVRQLKWHFPLLLTRHLFHSPSLSNDTSCPVSVPPTRLVKYCRLMSNGCQRTATGEPTIDFCMMFLSMLAPPYGSPPLVVLLTTSCSPLFPATLCTPSPVTLFIPPVYVLFFSTRMSSSCLKSLILQ